MLFEVVVFVEMLFKVVVFRHMCAERERETDRRVWEAHASVGSFKYVERDRLVCEDAHLCG